MDLEHSSEKARCGGAQVAVVHTYNSSARKAETGGFLGLTDPMRSLSQGTRWLAPRSNNILRLIFCLHTSANIYTQKYKNVKIAQT